MVPHRFQLMIIWGWLLTVAGLFALRLAVGVPPSFGEAFAALVLACVPAFVVMKLFRGASPTVAQLLYDTERDPTSSASSSRGTTGE